MARYQYDEEQPLYYKPHVPGNVIVGTKMFFVMCVLSLLGALTLLLMLLGV